MEASKNNQVAEIQLVYKSKVKAADRPKVNGARDVYKLLLDCWDDNLIELVEHFKVLFLNRRNHVLGIYHLSEGSATATVVDIRLVLVAALKANAQAIIIAHNHPSGNQEPSSEDVALTRKLAAAGKLIDIKLLDHLIVTTDGFYSLSENGLL